MPQSCFVGKWSTHKKKCYSLVLCCPSPAYALKVWISSLALQGCSETAEWDMIGGSPAINSMPTMETGELLVSSSSSLFYFLTWSWGCHASPPCYNTSEQRTQCPRDRSLYVEPSLFKYLSQVLSRLGKKMADTFNQGANISISVCREVDER